MAELVKATVLRSVTKVRGFKSRSLHNICSSVVECFPSKEVAGVRFPSDVKVGNNQQLV